MRSLKLMDLSLSQQEVIIHSFNCNEYLYYNKGMIFLIFILSIQTKSLGLVEFWISSHPLSHSASNWANASSRACHFRSQKSASGHPQTRRCSRPGNQGRNRFRAAGPRYRHRHCDSAVQGSPFRALPSRSRRTWSCHGRYWRGTRKTRCPATKS